jgi:WD40 repeat protein
VSPDPAPRETIRILAGADTRDTVGTRFPLTLEVSKADGTPAAAWILSFRALPPVGSGTALAGQNVLVLRPGGDPFERGQGQEQYVEESTAGTDVQGQARMWIKLGPRPGNARLEIRTETGSRDTVRFDVLPGNPVEVHILPADTSLYVGRSLTVSASVRDRLGNPRSESVVLSPLTPNVSLASNTVTGVSHGATGIVARAGSWADTARIGVVPQGILAASHPFSGTYMFGLDGSGLRLLIPGAPQVTWTSWSPDGREVVAGGSSELQVVTVSNGSVRRVGAGATGTYAGSQWAPQYAPDGAWIYFTATVNSPELVYPTHLLRVRPNDSQWGLVPAIPDSFVRYPAPSPDGVHLLYSTLVDGGSMGRQPGPSRILNLQTGSVTTIPFPMHAPRWSPNGQQIAYIDFFSAFFEGGNLKVTDAQGTAPTTLGSGSNRYWYGMDWSPNGEWIVVANLDTEVLNLIHGISGQVIPLPAYTRYMRSPAWKP